MKSISFYMKKMKHPIASYKLEINFIILTNFMLYGQILKLEIIRSLNMKLILNLETWKDNETWNKYHVIMN